jgi:hypothetical protein
MLPGLMGICGFIGGGATGISQTDSRTAEATSHSAVSFGADTSGRQIVILVWHNDRLSTPGNTPTATIGGVAATRIAAYTTGSGSGAAVGTAIFVAAPTGASGTVAVSWSGASVTIVALRLTGYAVPAFASGGHATDGDTYALGVPTNGLVIGMAGENATGTNVSWTNLTEQGNDDASGSSRSWGWDQSLGAQTRSITYSPYSGTPGANTFAVASFSPSP